MLPEKTTIPQKQKKVTFDFPEKESLLTPQNPKKLEKEKIQKKSPLPPPPGHIHAKKGPKCHLDVNIDALVVRLLLDTGATADFIDEDLARRLQLTMYPLVQPGYTRLASSNISTQIAHEVSVKMLCNGISFHRGFYVYPNLNEHIIFGLPFVVDYEDHISFSAHTFNGKPSVRSEFASMEEPIGPKAKPTTVALSANSIDFEIQQMDMVDAARDCKHFEHELFLIFCHATEDNPTLTRGESKSDLAVNNIEFLGDPKANSIDPKVFDLSEFLDVIRDELPPTLPPERNITHKITVIPGSTPPHRPPYRLSAADKDELLKQLEELIKAEKVTPFGSPYGAPVIFVKKKDGTKRLCVDYRALNNITIRERFPLPLIDDLFDALAGAKCFSSLDLCSGYHQLLVNPEDVEKTAFVTPFGQYAWRVMPFGLTNAPATFQRMMNEVFLPILNRSVVVYLDDILVFSRTEREHADHLREVLLLLRKHKLIAKASKCFFFQKELKFLGHVLGDGKIRPDDSKLEAIKNWPMIKTVKQAQSFLGLANYYRRFIPNFSKYTACMHDFVAKKVPWGDLQQEMFLKVKEKLVSPPLLILPDPNNIYVVFTDASHYYMGAVLHQVNRHNILQGVVAYESRKFSGAELNYDTREKEFYSIIHALKKWKHYLMDKRFILYTDHHSLQFVLKQKLPTGRVIRWLDTLADYDMDIRYIQGPKNVVADCLSRKDIDLLEAVAPYEVSVPERISAVELLTNAVAFTRHEISYDETTVEQLKREYIGDSEFHGPFTALTSDKDIPPEIKSKYAKFVIIGGLLYFSITTKDELRLCIPLGSTRNAVLELAHDTAAAGHRGFEKTYDLIARDYYWRKMMLSCRKYVAGCEVCQKTKSSSLAPAGMLLPLTVPDRRWQSITMDFLTGIRTSVRGFDRILVVIDRLSKMAHFIPTVKKLNTMSCMDLLLEHVFRLHGVPKDIISDRDIILENDQWKGLMTSWGIKTRFSTTEHPQTDGQSERLNRTMQDIVRPLLEQLCKDYHYWDYLLPMAEFAYNNAYQASIDSSPFYANYGYHPQIDYFLPKIDQYKNDAQKEGREFVEDQLRVLRRIRDNLSATQDIMSAATNRHRRHITYEVGDKVLVARRFFDNPKSDNQMKFHPLFVGPFKIKAKVNDNAYQVDLPSDWRSPKRPTQVFNITSLKPFRELDPDFEKIPPHTVEGIIQNCEQILQIESHGEQYIYLKWKDSEHTLLIRKDEYTQLPARTRARLERDYNLRLPQRPIHSLPQTVPSSNGTSIDALASLYARGRAQR